MAENKKSFVLYCDLIHTIKHLSKSDRGELLTHVLEYVNDKNPKTENQLVLLAFEPIKQHLKRDLKKYESRAKRARENGKKGGRPKTQKTQPVNLKPKKPVSVSVSVSDNVSVNDNVNKEFLRKETEWRNKLLKHLNIELEEYNKHLDEFEIAQDLDRPEKEIKTHFFNWIKLRDLKKKRIVIRSFDDINPDGSFKIK